MYCSVSVDPADEPCGLVSPSATVRCITKEFQHSLDLASATSGDKVVTAQVVNIVISEKNVFKYTEMLNNILHKNLINSYFGL